jgi:hypothetical protein
MKKVRRLFLRCRARELSTPRRRRLAFLAATGNALERMFRLVGSGGANASGLMC